MPRRNHGQGDHVRALINEAEDRARLMLQKARTLQAMADQLDTTPSREPIPSEVQTRVWQRDQGCCVVCGSNQRLEFDHIVPAALGGASTFRNVQLLCADCNHRKGATLGGDAIRYG